MTDAEAGIVAAEERACMKGGAGKGNIVDSARGRLIRSGPVIELWIERG